jgi:hypothetical protein
VSSCQKNGHICPNLPKKLPQLQMAEDCLLCQAKPIRLPFLIAWSIAFSNVVKKKLHFPTIPPDIFSPQKKRASSFNGGRQKGSHLCGVAKFKPSGESHGDFLKLTKKHHRNPTFPPISPFLFFPSILVKTLKFCFSYFSYSDICDTRT